MVRCVVCSNVMTWARQRVQYVRATRRGLTAEAARALMPCCQKCMTQALKVYKQNKVDRTEIWDSETKTLFSGGKVVKVDRML